MMENQLFQDGVMVKLEHFYHSLGNYCTSSTMLIIMDAQLYQQLLMEPESFQVELKDKLEFGKTQFKTICSFISWLSAGETYDIWL